MAHGKPIVAAAAGGTPEVVEHGKTGLLIEYGDLPGLTGAIGALLENPALRRQFGTAGYQKARTDFSAERIGKRWADICDQLMLVGQDCILRPIINRPTCDDAKAHPCVWR
jgi:glycosyltransferase involved in cell wall biosynthesis